MAKFIHTSDWHIGRQFQNRSLLEDQIFALEQIKGYAKDYDVDALLIAGDIYDRSVPPSDAVEALDRFLLSFTRELKIPVVMISGNHDSAQRLGFGSAFMRSAGVHILADLRQIDRPVQLKTKTGPVEIFGIPFNDPVEVREAYGVEVRSYDQAHTYLIDKIMKAKTPGTKSVFMSHCFLSGSSVSDSERTLSVGGADQVTYEPMLPFDYVALGHLHEPQSKGADHIRYSGSLLKYSFSEVEHSKGVLLVDLAETTRVTHLPIHPMRDMRIIEGTLQELIDRGRVDPKAEDYILARLTDTADLLEPMARLREVYPNTLELQRPEFIRTSGSRLVTDVGVNRSEIEIFNDFFSQVMGSAMDQQQSQHLISVIQAAKDEDAGSV